MSREKVTQEVIDTLLEARYLLNKIAESIQDDEHEELMGEAEWLASHCCNCANSLEMLEYQETMQTLNS